MNQQLQDRITELVLNGDAPSLIWLVEGQLRITDLAYARIAELEEERDDCHAAYKELRAAVVKVPMDVDNSTVATLLNVLYPPDALVTFAETTP
jgi:hypothetical protein